MGWWYGTYVYIIYSYCLYSYQDFFDIINGLKKHIEEAMRCNASGSTPSISSADEASISTSTSKLDEDQPKKLFKKNYVYILLLFIIV